MTLTQQQGALLTALIAIFVGFAGTRIWIIICFMVHTSLSRDTPQDAIYHQRQVVFRNADNGSTGLWNLCMLVWAWRGLKGQVFRRLLPFIALSLVVTLAFTAAGIFSSTISAAGNEVLLTGAQCAIVRPTGQTTTANPSEEALDTAYWPFFHKLGKDNEERTLRCYTNSSTDDCSPTVVNKLAVMVDGNASCPFTHEICQDNTTSLMLETAYLNSNDDFGVNTPAAQRFSYRVRTQCSPLKLDGYTAIKHDLVAATDGSPNNITVAMMEFYYGEAFDLGQSANITYRYPVNYYNATPNGNQGRDYTLQ